MICANRVATLNDPWLGPAALPLIGWICETLPLLVSKYLDRELRFVTDCRRADLLRSSSARAAARIEDLHCCRWSRTRPGPPHYFRFERFPLVLHCRWPDALRRA